MPDFINDKFATGQGLPGLLTGLGMMAQHSKQQSEERMKKAQERLTYLKTVEGLTDEQIDAHPQLSYLRKVAYGVPEGSYPTVPSGSMKQVMGKDMPKELAPIGGYSAMEGTKVIGAPGMAEALLGTKVDIAKMRMGLQEAYIDLAKARAAALRAKSKGKTPEEIRKWSVDLARVELQGDYGWKYEQDEEVRQAKLDERSKYWEIYLTEGTIEQDPKKKKEKKTADERYNELKDTGIKEDEIYKKLAEEGY